MRVQAVKRVCVGLFPRADVFKLGSAENLSGKNLTFNANFIFKTINKFYITGSFCFLTGFKSWD